MGDISIETGKTKTFHIVDYVIFAAILAISAGIGFYHAWKDRKNQTLKQFLLAGANMSVFPVTLSLIASFMSAVTLLGVPVEMYQYSSMYFWIGGGYFLVMASAAHIYVPIFYRLKVTSVYEYLERRFGKHVRTAGSVTFCLQMILYMAIVLYAPSLALNAVTGFTLWGSVVSVGLVCTIYTAFGGMKAVLFTDCFQTGMMVAGLLAVLIRGSMTVGGFDVAWRKMETSGRVFFDDVHFDPAVRHTIWSLVIGGYFTWVAIYGVNQAMVQRACTLPTLRKAQIAIWLNFPGLCVILYLGCLIGVVVYGFYSECDPISAKLITSKDQILPLFVMDVLGDYTGLPGLFVACLFSGALSTISSGLNSIAACVLEDVIKAYFCKNLGDRWATRVTQILALVFGVICVALTFVASQMGNVLQAALSLFGMIAGPLLGIFTLGIFFPWANKWGALSGLAGSLALLFWIGIGSFIEKPPVLPHPPPMSLAGCHFNNNTAWNMTTVVTTIATTTLAPERSAVYRLYTLSYIWYGMYSVITVVVIGLIVSFITGYTRPSTLDPRLICPIFDLMPPFCFLPEVIRKPLRFGIVYDGIFEDTNLTEEKLAELDDKKISEFYEHTSEFPELASEQMKDIQKNGIYNPGLVYDDDVENPKSANQFSNHYVPPPPYETSMENSVQITRM